MKKWFNKVRTPWGDKDTEVAPKLIAIYLPHRYDFTPDQYQDLFYSIEEKSDEELLTKYLWASIGILNKEEAKQVTAWFLSENAIGQEFLDGLRKGER